VPFLRLNLDRIELDTFGANARTHQAKSRRGVRSSAALLLLVRRAIYVSATSRSERAIGGRIIEGTPSDHAG